MAKDKKKAEHSLTTEILMNMKVDFENARNDIDTVAESIDKLSNPVLALKQAMHELNDKPIQNIIDVLQKTRIDDANITSSQLRIALEEKIKESIMKSKIDFVGEDGDRKRIKVKMGAEFWEKNKESIQASIGQSLSNIVIEKGDIPPLDVTEIMREFGASFNENIAELVKSQGTFDLYTEKGGVKVPRYKTPFKLNKQSITNIMETLSDTFTEYLMDPDNIELAELPQLKISSEELTKVVDKISESIGNIDEHMGVDPKALDELPNISIKLKVFKDKLVDMVEDINKLSTELESLTIGEVTDQDIKRAITSVERLKESVVVNLDKWVSKLAKELTTSIKKDSDITKLKASMDDINKYIDELVQSKLNQIKTDIETLTISSSEKDLKRINEIPNMIAYQITSSVIEKFTEMGAMDFGIDLGQLDSVLSQYGGEFQTELEDTLISVINAATEGIKNTDFSEMEKLNAQVATELKGSYTEFTNKLVKSVESVLDNVSTLIGVSDIDVGGVDVTKLPDMTKEELTKINKHLAERYDHYKANDYNIREIVGNFFSKALAEEIEYLDKSLARGKFDDTPQDKFEEVKKSVESRIEGYKKGLEQVNKSNQEAAALINPELIKDLDNITTDIDKVVERIKLSLKETVDKSVETLDKQIQGIFAEARRGLNDADLGTQTGQNIINELRSTVDLSTHLLESQIFNIFNEARTELRDSKDESDVSTRVAARMEDIVVDTVNAMEQKIQGIFDSIGTATEGLSTKPDAGRDLTINIKNLVEKMVTTVEDALGNYLVNLVEIEDNFTSDDGMSSKISEKIKDMTREINKVLNDSVGEIKIPKSHINSLVRTFNRMSKNLVDKLGVEVENLEIIGGKPIKVDIKQAIKIIETELNEHIKNMTLGLDEDKTPKFNVTRLNNNLDKLIQKHLNAKATAIGKMKPKVGDEVNDIHRLQKNIGEYIKKSIENYDVAMKESINKKFSAKGMGYIFDKVVGVFNRAFYSYSQQITKSFENMAMDDFSMSTRELNTETRKKLADKLGVTVSELLEEIPEFEGVGEGREVMRANVEVITDSVNKFIGVNLKNLMDYYKETLKDTNIEPDAELTGYVLTEIRKFQDVIIKKTKEMVREQFKFLTEEINAMNIDAKSLGYKPTQAFDRAAARANPNLMTSENMTVAELKEVIKSANKESTVKVDKMSLSGTTIDAEGLTQVDTDQIKANIKDTLVTEAPNVIVNGKTIDLKSQDFNLDKFAKPLENYLEKLPFTDDMAQILPQLNKLQASDFIKGSQYANPYNPLNIDSISFYQPKGNVKHGMTKIFENMARYFFVGYALQLPIKAITAATKVSSELDYRVAKSRQNILIKDPTMANTARGVVYDRYQAEGRDVGGSDFQQDVKSESAKLRSMMSNEMNDYLLNISKAYYQDIGKVGKFYEVASRRSSNPYDALTKTKEIAKIAAAEMDMDTEFAGIGLEALSVQWGIDAAELSRYSNMMLKTAMLSSTTVTDLLSTQRDTGEMFRSRMSELGDERAYATSMALSSMFTESTGKTGREGGTFWRNILNRPYTKDSRKYLEAAAQYPEFEGLDPYYTDADGNRKQKDFLTMVSGILESAMKVDDPSKMSMYAELFPIRTIGGAESVTSLVKGMQEDFEKTLQIMRETGEIDPDVTIETVNVKDVIEAYVDKIVDVTDYDIAEYIAGLQDTYKFNVQGLSTQWESTVYNIFMEFKEEASIAMTYLTHILRMFEANSGSLSEVIGVFAKIGAGLVGEKLIRLGVDKYKALPIKPNDFQKKMAEDYNLLRVAEHASKIEVDAIQSIVTPLANDIEVLNTQRMEVMGKMSGYQGYLDNFGAVDTPELRTKYDKAEVELALLTHEYEGLGRAIRETEETMRPYVDTLNEATKSHSRLTNLGEFLNDGMGARNPKQLQSNLGEMYRNNYAYNEVAKFTLRNQPNFSDEWYARVHDRKSVVEEQMRNQQKLAIDYYRSTFPKAAEKDLSNILGDNYGDPMYGVGNRLTEQSTSIMNGIARSIQAETSGTGEFHELFSEIQKDFERTKVELSGINEEIVEMTLDKHKVERLIFEAERPVVGAAGMVEKSQKDITNMYRDLLPTAGVDVAQFEGGMDQLKSMFNEGKVDVDKYEDSLRDVSRQLGVADQDFSKFKEIIRQINAEVKLGKAGLQEYIRALNSAKTTGVTLGVGAKGKGAETEVEPPVAGGNNVAANTVKVVAATSGLAKLLSKFKMGGAAVGGGAAGTAAATVAGTTVKAGIGAALAKGAAVLGTTAVAGLKMALTYAIVDTISKGMGGSAERTMSDADRLGNQADRLESLTNKQVSMRPREDDGFMRKWVGRPLGYIATAYEGLTNQINKSMGGTAPSFSETMGIRKEIVANSGLSDNDLKNYMDDQLGIRDKRYESAIQKQQDHLSQNPFLTRLGERIDYTDKKTTQIPLEEMMTVIEREMGYLNEGLTKSGGLLTQERLRLLISGSTENNEKIREAIQRSTDANIEELTKTLESFRQYLNQLPQGTPNYMVMEASILDLENQLAQQELDRIENQFAEFSEIIDNAGKRGTDIQARYDIKRYDALLSGIKDDSHAIRQIENRMAEAQIQSIDTTKTALRELLDKFGEDTDKGQQILAQMLQLDVETRRILLDIKDKMPGTLSTFNLPSEIKPITYFEAMARKNTAKNMSIRAGDTIVNVNIDNMSGSDADIDKMGRAVSGAVNQVQKNYVRQFANDVKSGMGNNYYSWNQY